MSRIRKLIVSLIGALAMAIAMGLTTALTDNHITPSEWIQLAIAAVTAFSVWLTANEPGWGAAKTTTAAALAVLSLLVSAVTGGVSHLEFVNLVIAALTAVGVHYVQNATAPPPPMPTLRART
jgi:ABC-type enterochelin transport system permease subunit